MSAPPSTVEPSIAPALFIDEGGPLSWVFSIDHRRIALMQLLGIAAAALIGTAVALVLQLERVTPQSNVLAADAFAASFTMHGSVMIFLLLMPAIPSCLAAAILPRLLGARGFAFPRLHLLSLQLWLVGGLLLVMAIALGGATAGWTLSVPLSLNASTPSAYLAWGMIAVVLSTVLHGIVVITSIHKLRRPELSWSQLSPFAWSLYAHSVVTLIAGPILMMTIIMLLTERTLQLGIFDPALGGDPLLFQNFFWFGAHGMIYAAVLPAVGIISEVFVSLGHPQKQAPRSFLIGLTGLSLVALLSWGMQSPTSGHSVITLTFFSLFTLLSLVPGTQIVGSWMLSLRQGVRKEAPFYFALGALLLFIIGGLATLPLGALSTAVHLHGTTFAVAQFHLVFGSVALAFLAGLHLCWSDLGLPSYSSIAAKIGASFSTLGMLVTFTPLLLLGAQGLPRRMASYPEHMQPLQIVSAVGAAMLSVGLSVVAFNLLSPLFREQNARS